MSDPSTPWIRVQRTRIAVSHEKVLGSDSCVSGDWNTVHGHANICHGDNLSIRGDDNVVVGNFCCVIGLRNRIVGNGNLTRTPDEDSTYPKRVVTMIPIPFEAAPEHSVGERDRAHTLLCRICMTRELKTCFEPCRHCVSCLTCAQELARGGASAPRCPICQQNVTEVRRIYL